MPAAEAPPEPFVVPLLARDDIAKSHEILKAVRMAQVEDGPEVADLAGQALAINPDVILSVRLPLGPACFPADYLTDQPERFLVAETIREKVLLVTRQEVPHSVAVTIEEWTETPRLFKIAATIHVERNGQKPIVIGAAGARLKEIGTQARGDCEKLLGKKMFLQLFVKVSEKWREREEFLNQLDWRTASPPPAPPVLGETMDSRITPPALAETMDAPTVPPAPAESTGSTEGGNEHNGE